MSVAPHPLPILCVSAVPHRQHHHFSARNLREPAASPVPTEPCVLLRIECKLPVVKGRHRGWNESDDVVAEDAGNGTGEQVAESVVSPGRFDADGVNDGEALGKGRVWIELVDLIAIDDCSSDRLKVTAVRVEQVVPARVDEPYPGEASGR